MEELHGRVRCEYAVVSCNHSNPAGYVCCGKCGEPLEVMRCRCGFVAASGDAYCGRCGVNLTVEVARSGTVQADAKHRYDLEFLVQQAALEQQELPFHESNQKVRVKQDDIRKLLALRRKKV